MIKSLPLIAVIAAGIYLFIKVLDEFIEAAVFFHSLNDYRHVFDDFEAELCQLEAGGMSGTDGADAGSRAMAEFGRQLETELSTYRIMVSSNRLKYRCWRLFFHENRLVEHFRGHTGTNDNGVAACQG